jgi:hypothetical protein
MLERNTMAWHGRLHGSKTAKGSDFYKLDSDKEEIEKEKISEEDLIEKMSQMSDRLNRKRNGRTSPRKVSSPNRRKHGSI